jgi:hypothetical protein
LPLLQGRNLIKDDRVAFSQWTDKGYVLFHVAVPIGACMRWRSKSFIHAAAPAVEDDVLREGKVQPRATAQAPFWRLLSRTRTVPRLCW